MVRLWHMAAALVMFPAAALAQFAPPGGTVSPPATGPTIAPTTGGTTGPTLRIDPPQAVPSPTSGNMSPSPLASPSMTTSALIGFVNDDPMFVTDLFRPLDADLKRMAANAKSLSDFKQAAAQALDSELQHAVSERVFVAAAQTELTEQDRAKIDVVVALQRSKLIAEHGGSIPAADKFLAAQGSSVDREMAELRRVLIMQIYREKHLFPQVVITRQMLVDAYDKDPKRWQVEAQIELYTITLPVTNWLREPSTNGQRGPIKMNPNVGEIQAAESQALATGREIIGKLKAGADFATLVEDYDSRDAARTTGGRHPTVNRGSMANTRLEDFVFSLPANSTPDLKLFEEKSFRDSIVVVARVGKKTEARTIPFSEAQDQLREELRQARITELQGEIMDRLARRAAIEAVDRMRGVALDAAVTRYYAK